MELRREHAFCLGWLFKLRDERVFLAEVLDSILIFLLGRELELMRECGTNEDCDFLPLKCVFLS